MQKIEIEFKNLITENEFKRLLKALPFPPKGQKQINYYFDTEDFQLQKNQSAFRIRKRNNQYIATIKQPHPEGILETNSPLTEIKAKQWKQGNKEQIPSIQQQLDKIDIPLKKLQYFGSLTTIRRTIKQDSLKIVLDESFYHDKKDFELEVEAINFHSGERYFSDLLQKYEIKQRPTVNKIERFFQTLKK